ncbi:MAG: hypothetical protein ACKVUS_21050 [Saprospiraceae bacterium]
MEQQEDDEPIFCRSCGVSLRHELFPHTHEKKEGSTMIVSRMRICSACDSVVLEVFSFNRIPPVNRTVSEFYPDYRHIKSFDLKNLKDKIPPQIYSALEGVIESLDRNLLRGCYCYLLSMIELLCDDRIGYVERDSNIVSKVLKIKDESIVNPSQHHIGERSKEVYENLADFAVKFFENQENICNPDFTPEREMIINGLNAILSFISIEYLSKKSIDTAFDDFNFLTKKITQSTRR